MQGGWWALLPQRICGVRFLRSMCCWVIVFLATAIILIGCKASGRDAQLLGSWELDAGVGKVIVVYSDDHTYVMTGTGARSLSMTGNWRIDGNRLITTIKTSTLDETDVGKQESNEIMRLDDTILIIKDHDKDGKEEMRV